MEDPLSGEHSKDGGVKGDAKRRPRRPKSGNSELFNNLLSAANQLSVAERTRLVKSLAGQLGLLAVGGQTLIDKPVSTGKTRKEDHGTEVPTVRPNPLKNTKFWLDKEAAKAAMLRARDEKGPGAKLPPDHEAVKAYAQALKLYKEEQAKLKPVIDPAKQGQQQPSGGPRRGTAAKRTTSERSPEPKRTSTALSLLSSAAKQSLGFRSRNPDGDNKDVKMDT